MRRVLLPLLFLFGISLSAQEQFVIRVIGPDDKPISGARVTVHTMAKYVKAPSPDLVTVYTNADGEALVPISDVQHAQILAAGFKPAWGDCDGCGPVQHVTTYKLQLAPRSDEVQVTASGSELAGAETGTVPSSLDSKTIELIQPTAVSEAIRFLPGAVVNSQGRRGGLASLFVRGGESRYNKFIVDGVTVNDVGGTFDFGVVPTQEFNRIEFVRGAESALYGTDAMTSTLQTFSQTGSTRVPELRFGADGGTFGTAHGYASLGGVIRKFD